MFRYTYRLESEILGTQLVDDHRIAVTIPADASVGTNTDLRESDQDVIVDWGGFEVTVFTVDLRSRGKLISQERVLRAGG